MDDVDGAGGRALAEGEEALAGARPAKCQPVALYDGAGASRNSGRIDEGREIDRGRRMS